MTCGQRGVRNRREHHDKKAEWMTGVRQQELEVVLAQRRPRRETGSVPRQDDGEQAVGGIRGAAKANRYTPALTWRCVKVALTGVGVHAPGARSERGSRRDGRRARGPRDGQVTPLVVRRRHLRTAVGASCSPSM